MAGAHGRGALELPADRRYADGMDIVKQGRSVALLIGLAVVVLIVGTAALVLSRGGGADGGVVRGGPETWPAAVRQQVAAERQRATDLIHMTNFAGAQVVLEQLLRQYPDDAESHSLLAQALVGQGKLEPAYRHAARATALGPRQEKLHQFAGQLAAKLGDYDQAKQHYQAAADLAPEAPQHPLLLAALHLQLNELDEAQFQALRALQRDASVHQAYAIVSQAAARKGKLDMAVDQINKALILVEPGSDRAITYTISKAQLLRRANRPGEALDTIAALGEIALSMPRLVEEQAACYLMLSKPDDAARAWAELLIRQPTNANAAAQAALNYQRAGNQQLASHYLMLAERLKPHHPIVMQLKDEGLSAGEAPEAETFDTDEQEPGVREPEARGPGPSGRR